MSTGMLLVWAINFLILGCLVWILVRVYRKIMK